MSERAVRTAGSVLVAAATAIVLVQLAVLAFLSPAWIAFAQGRAEATAWTGYTPEQLRAATDAIVADLVVGPPDFDVVVDGRPVLTEAEQAHMRDVRGVFGAAALVSVMAWIVLAAAAIVARRSAWVRPAARGGALALGGGVVVLGVVGLVAFDVAFEAFHRLFFAGGNYAFDPATDRLVQLFPQRFWFETSVAAGAVILVLAALTARLASPRRARASAGPITARQATAEATR